MAAHKKIVFADSGQHNFAAGGGEVPRTASQQQDHKSCYHGLPRREGVPTPIGIRKVSSEAGLV